jgi:hypothetical protein
MITICIAVKKDYIRYITYLFSLRIIASLKSKLICLSKISVYIYVLSILSLDIPIKKFIIFKFNYFILVKRSFLSLSFILYFPLQLRNRQLLSF